MRQSVRSRRRQHDQSSDRDDQEQRDRCRQQQDQEPGQECGQRPRIQRLGTASNGPLGNQQDHQVHEKESADDEPDPMHGRGDGTSHQQPLRHPCAEGPDVDADGSWVDDDVFISGREPWRFVDVGTNRHERVFHLRAGRTDTEPPMTVTNPSIVAVSAMRQSPKMTTRSPSTCPPICDRPLTMVTSRASSAGFSV